MFPETLNTAVQIAIAIIVAMGLPIWESIHSDTATEESAGIVPVVTSDVSRQLHEIERQSEIDRLQEQESQLAEEVRIAEEHLVEARAALENEPEVGEDPATNEGHIEWTALGLYRHILDGTGEDDPEHWDA